MKESILLTNLEQLGLRHGESQVYLALLKLGKCPVREIKEETGLHRTGIYDFLEQLINRGFVSYSLENGVRQYSPTPPRKFQELVDEQQRILSETLPDLQQRYEQKTDDLEVELSRGKEAIKSFLADIIDVGENYVCLGVDEGWWNEQFPIITAQHMKKERKANITWRAIAQKDTGFVYDFDAAEYRFLPSEHFGPLHTIVYGDNVAIIVREPLSVVTLRNKTLADAQKKQFEALWVLAEPK